ncbi:MAG: hypothetical protein A2Y97_07765 [Nitrospirae bacterium RBG_13_39_12]|nr:MAG: hypothetical protein A2Y97_07765 [Nitrospirae bacterium RBG_13_39_12]
MGKKKKETTLSLNFAIQFLKKQLPEDICNDATKKARGNIEDVFPLNHVNSDRQNERIALWQKIKTLTSNKTTLTCKAALIAFLNLHLPYAWIIRDRQKDYDASTYNKEILQLEKILSSINFIFPKTHNFIRKEIRYKKIAVRINTKDSKNVYKFTYSIDDVIALYRDFLEATKAVDLKDMTPQMLNAFLRPIQEHQRLEITYTQNPSDLSLKALEFVIFISLWEASKKKKESARRTAELINEYLYYNTLFSDISKKETESKILNLWNGSKYYGEFLHGKTPQYILK